MSLCFLHTISDTNARGCLSSGPSGAKREGVGIRILQLLSQNTRTWVVWNNRSLFCHTSGSQKSEIMLSVGLHCLRRLEGRVLLFKVLVVPSVPGLWPHQYALHLLGSWPSLCGCVFSPLFLARILIRFRGHPDNL